MNKGGFSWKRFTGVTRAKRRISRATGIPMSRSGRQQKAGRMMSSGCLISLLVVLVGSCLGVLTERLINERGSVRGN